MKTFIARVRGSLWSKTVWFGFALAALGYAQASRDDVQAYVNLLPEELRPFVWPTIGFIVVWLRFVTTQPLEQK